MNPRLSLCALLCILCLGWSPASAGELDGTWLFDGGTAELDARDAAVQSAVDTFPLLLRGIAARRLQRSAIRPDRYVIEDRTDTILMQLDDAAPHETDLVGTPITFTPDGQRDAVTLARQRQGRAVHSTVTADTGSLESHFERAGEGLTVTLTVSSERLASPVIYSLTYRRQ